MNLNIISKQNMFKIQVVAILIILLLFFLVIYIPLLHKINRLKSDNLSKYNYLKKIILLSNSYKSLVNRQGNHHINNTNIDNLVTFMQNILKQLEIEKNLVSITPSTRKLDNNREEKFLDLKLENLGLRETTSFLKNIYATKQIDVIRLNIERTQKDPSTIILSILIKAKAGQ